MTNQDKISFKSHQYQICDDIISTIEVLEQSIYLGAGLNPTQKEMVKLIVDTLIAKVYESTKKLDKQEKYNELN